MFFIATVRVQQDCVSGVHVVVWMVRRQVAAALSDQICSLPILVDEFRADFNPTKETLELYKTVSAAATLLSLAHTVNLCYKVQS